MKKMRHFGKYLAVPFPLRVDKVDKVTQRVGIPLEHS